jgi:hypothetical protein
MRTHRWIAVAAAALAACARPPAPLRTPATPEQIAPRSSATTSVSAAAPVRGDLPPNDRIRLAEALRLAAAWGTELWPDWTAAPFSILLITPQQEFLVNERQLPAGFAPVGYDSLLKTVVFARAREMSPQLLATFPAFGAAPTVVVGPPEGTGKASTRWLLTVLHEHFHQLQMSRPGYASGVAALGLARGDRTGAWMLNYAFPYDSANVQAAFDAFVRSIDTALAEGPREARQARWRAIVDARARLRATLSPDDDRYLAFQMWQEGVSRYTELRVARWAATRFTPSPEFRALPDFTSFAVAADSIEAAIHAGLRDNPLGRTKRVAFYAAGAAMALALDRFVPDWRARYFDGYSLDGVAP